MMTDSPTRNWPEEPAVVVSHSTATDQVGPLLGVSKPRGHTFQFIRSTEELEPKVPEALAQVLGARHALHHQGGVSSKQNRRRNPVMVQICAFADIAGSIDDLILCTEIIRHEFNRSLLSGMIVLVVYVGPINGTLPDRQLLGYLKTIEPLFDLVVIVSDTDARGLRYDWPDLVTVIAIFLNAFLGVSGLRQFAFDIAQKRDPRNRRITFGLASLDVSCEALQSFTYANLSKTLFGILFPPEQSGRPSTTPSTDQEYLAARHRGSGGALGPVASALEPMEEKLARNFSSARAREASRKTAETLRQLSQFRKSPFVWIWELLLRCLVWSHAERRGPRQSERITAKKAQVFQQLLRLKHVELKMQPLRAARCDSPLFPLVLSLADLVDGREAFLSRLPDLGKVARSLAQETSLPDILAGRVTPEQLIERLDSLWDEHQVGQRIRDFIESEDVGMLLRVLAARLSPLFPSAGYEPGRLLLVPSNVTPKPQVEGFGTATGLLGQYVLLGVNDCLDITCLKPTQEPNP